MGGTWVGIPYMEYPLKTYKQSYTYSNAQTPTYSIYGKFGMHRCITVLPIPYME